MPSSSGTLFALIALGSMSIAAVPQCAVAGDSITVAVCGEHGTVTIPLGRSTPHRGGDCTGGCHAVCHRMGLLPDDEDPARPD